MEIKQFKEQQWVLGAVGEPDHKYYLEISNTLFIWQ